MAGRGSRFPTSGTQTPKPLIPVGGKPIVWWAVQSLPYPPETYIFVCLREHIEKHILDAKLKSLFSNDIRLVIAEHITEGQACTVLLAKEAINNGQELIIFNCDTYFRCPLEEHIARYPETAGFIPVFDSVNPKWSFARVNDKGYVIEVAEKKPISRHATVGLYYFRHGSDFVWGAEQMMAKNLRVNEEFYVGPIYNELIARGDLIRIIDSDFVWGLGTPEDLHEFKQRFLSQLRKEK